MALWAPDIEPPAEWLVPAILYQDKIATFAPEPHLDESDGQVARRMERILGDLYEPVSLPATFHGSEFVLDEIRSRLDGWMAMAGRMDPSRSSFISRWRDRVLKLSSVRGSKVHQLHEIDAKLGPMKESFSSLRSRLAGLEEGLSAAVVEMEALKAAARPGNELAKAARRAAVSPIVERMRPLLDRRMLLDRRSDEFSQVSRQIDALRIEIRDAQREHSNPRNPALEGKGREVADLRAQVIRLKLEFSPLASEVGELSRRRASVLEWLDAPYGRNDSSGLDPGFSAGDLWALPSELDTIAVGKVYGDLFKFLATDARLWVATRPDRSYAGTLVGPRFVVEDVMMILARHLSERRDYCSLMTRNDRVEALRRNMSWTDGVVTVAWFLPSPLTTDLAAVREFRERHEDELRVLRSHLRVPLYGAETPQELESAIRDIEKSCGDASREISRALELDRRVGLKHVRGSISSELRSSASDILSAAALGSIPVLSSAFSAGEALSELPLGLTVAGVTLAGKAAVDTYRAHTARKRITKPFLYSYEAMRTLGREPARPLRRRPPSR